MIIMTKEEFEKIVREKCPPQALSNELAKLDEHYEVYLFVAENLCDGKICEFVYDTNDETGGLRMLIGASQSTDLITPLTLKWVEKHLPDEAPRLNNNDKFYHPTETMIAVGAETLLRGLKEYRNDLVGFSKQIALDIYATMVNHEDVTNDESNRSTDAR